MAQPGELKMEELDIGAGTEQLGKTENGIKLRSLYDGIMDDATVINSASRELLEPFFESYPSKTMEIFISNDMDVQILVKCLNVATSRSYLGLLSQYLKKAEDEEYCLRLLDSLVNNFEYELSEMESVISLVIPLIDKYRLVTMILVKLYAIYKTQITEFFTEQLVILSLDRIVSSCQFLVLMFQLDSASAAIMFETENVQSMLHRAGKSGSQDVIRSGLTLLSIACVEESIRKKISSEYLEVLTQGTKDPNVNTIAALVIVKTWDFQSLANKQISLEDITAIFLKSMDDHSIEGLAYLSMKKSVKSSLRQDGEFLIELVKKLEVPGESLYGILVTLANLTVLEDDNEVSQLKKHAQKGMEEGLVESTEEIHEFMDDLIELQVVAKICSHSKMTKQSMDQAIRVIYNLCKRFIHHIELVRQGALPRLLDFIGKETDYTEYKVMAYKSLASLLTNVDPHIAFGPNVPAKSSVNYLFQFLALDNIASKDQYQCLLSLTNLSVVDHDAITGAQWEHLDDLLTQEHTMVKRATLELVSNLMQHKSNLPALFNWENVTSKKRFELVVELTRVHDVKSQSSAISSLSYAITFQFIGEALLKSERLKENIVKIVNEQSDDVALMERTAYVLYYLMFYADGTDDIEWFKGNTTLVTAIGRAVPKAQGELLEMLTEIQKLLQ